MERAKFLFKAGITAMLSGSGVLIVTAQQQEFIPFMLICAGLSYYTAVKCFVAGCVLRDEEEELLKKNY